LARKEGVNVSDVVLYEVADRIATVTINRPEARNALSSEVRRALRDTFRRADADEAVDVVILTGADPAFCAGLDLKELGAGELDLGNPGDAAPQGATSGPLPDIDTPVIGAVNGAAITGGFELALACDFLVASERARFADTHARVGIQPGWGLTVLLPEAVGLRRAKEMSATGNFCDAATALSWGLVNHVVPHEELLPFCRGLAADIASNDAGAVHRIYRTYDEGALVTRGQAWQLEGRVAEEWLSTGGASADDIEGRRAAVTARGRSQQH
jgi:enoyl-CoA hydratase